MQLNIDPDWLREMAAKEDCKIISAGGWVTQVKEVEPEIPDLDAMLQPVAEEMGISLDEVKKRFFDSFAPDPELEAVLEKLAIDSDR